MPNGAKFCPNCGALMTAANESKTYCSNCGLELPKGAKFCAVCGAAANTSSNAEVKPSSVLDPVTLGAPVSADPSAGLGGSENAINAVGAAVSENPGFSIPQADTSMPSVGAPVAASIPEPVSSAVPEPIFAGEEVGVIPEASTVPMGAPSPAASIPTPVSAPSYSAQTAMPGYSVPEANPMPTYSPNANQPAGGFADLGLNGAAAVAVKPVKKKSVLKPILIVLGSLIGAALIAAGVLFFVNRAFLFNIVMGNSGYAAYVEGNSIKSVTDNMDPAVLASSIKSASASVAQSMQALTSGTTVSPMSANSSVSMSSMSNMGTMDWNTALKSYADSIKEVYGTSGVKMSADMKLELTDTAKSMLGNSSADTDKILEMFNNCGFIADMAFEEDAMDMAIEVNSGSLKLNAKTVITENGDIYLAFPFASDKAIMLNLGTTAAAPVEQDIYLELDEKEVKKLMEQLVNIYINAYKASEVTVESGEISIGGAVAKGKHIKVNLTGDKLTKLFSDMGEAIKNNDYLVEKFVKFINDCGAPMTKDQFKNSISSIFSMMKMPENCGFVIDTITDNNCNVLAKTYDMIAYGKSTMKIGYIGDLDTSTKTSSTAALSIEAGDEFSLTATMNKESDSEGKISVTLTAEEFTGTINVKYSGVKETTYLGKPAYEGTYEISLAMPNDFTQEGGNDQIIEILRSMKIVLSSKYEGNTSTSTMTFDVPQYGKLSVNMAVTPEDRSVEIPKNATDITPYMDMNSDHIPENVKNDILGIVKGMRDAIKAQNAGEVGNAIVDALDEAIDLAENGPAADSADVSKLLNDVFNDMNKVTSFDSQYKNTDAALTEKSTALAEKYQELYNKISEKYLSDISQDEFDSFKAYYDALHSEMEALEKEYNPGGSSGMSGGGTNSKNVDFNSLTFESLSLILLEYEDRYVTLVEDNGSVDFSGAAMSYGEECFDAYEDAVDDYENLNDAYQSGSLELSLLRKSRKSTRAFAEAVEALEKAYNLSL